MKNLFLTTTVRTIMALAVLIGCFGFVGSIINYIDITTENRDIIMVLIGNISGWVMAIIGYYFGSTHTAHQNGNGNKENEIKTTN